MLMVSKFDLAAQLQSVRRVVLVALLLLALAVLAMGLAARAGRGASARTPAAGPPSRTPQGRGRTTRCSPTAPTRSRVVGHFSVASSRAAAP